MADPDQIPHRTWPCVGCPGRADAHNRLVYLNLAAYAEGTCGKPGAEAPLGALMFGCHMSRMNPAELCAWWLAVFGYQHLTVRLAIASSVLPVSVLEPGPGWPPLFPSLEAALASSEENLARLRPDAQSRDATTSAPQEEPTPDARGT